jgi:hypothetical protein
MHHSVPHPLALLLVGGLTGVFPAAVQSQCVSGITLDTVVVQAGGVFDEPSSELDLLSRVANSLHVRTRSGVIRRTLLVKAGDCYDPARVAESERALWALGVFRAVKVDTTRLEEGRLALRATTADGWSARPVVDYSRTGPATTWELGVFERNILGTAAQLFASYRSTPDRSWVALQYYTPHLFAPGLILWARHSEMSNGRQSIWLTGLPFRETRARRSATFEGEALDEQFLSFGEQTTTPGPRGRFYRLRFNLGYAPHATTRDYVRLWLGVRWRDEAYSPADSVPFGSPSRYATLGTGVELARVHWRSIRRLNTYGRPEWVDLSPWIRAGVWTAREAWGYPADRAGLGLELRSRLGVALPANRGHAIGYFDATGGWVHGVLDSGQVRARLTTVVQVGKHTALIHADKAHYLGQRPWGGYDLWMEGRGPRLLPPHVFMGQEVWWVLLEDRYALRESFLRQFGVGVSPFFEYAESRFVNGPLVAGGDIGVALRVVPLRMAAHEITELSVGYRFGGARGADGWGVGVRKGLFF